MSNQTEIRHLKYFLAVAEELHFRKAAEKLFISQPGLSRQIKQLEDDLGVTLFERSNKKVALTKAGFYLKKEITLTLKNLESVFEHTKLIDQGVEGEINLGYVGSAMQFVIPDLLIKAKEKYKNIQFSLKEMENPEQIEALLSQEIDLAFVRMDKVPRELKIQPIFEDTFSLVLPKDHPIDVHNFESLTQFKNEAFIFFEQSYSPDYFEKVMDIFKESGFSPIVSHNSVHASTIYKLVENKLGISIVPTVLKNGFNMDIKFIELDKIAQRTILSVAWNTKNRNPMLKNMLEFIL
ncbi:LysR family transcriptional regulator [Lutibacter sp. HS1-25]|uniref:LysR family transcriptional regulator n=1 Tax=Lutibacter sp. HS1-25 TaxID=2485000 RepID=UPI00101069F6|nr:LysR family transcriptional regulator [Lutibacter sp. HS1-25]RXP46497.1 LysR family transcriptional regulator [Lutibacter sp. HS1-25]